MPIMARRPLLTSASSAFSLRSGVILLVKPKGSHRLRGTGCGKASSSVRELREVARLSATHVVGLAVGLEDRRGLGPHLEEADHAEDLELGAGRERVPLVGGAAGRGDVSEGDRRERRRRANAAEGALDVPREADPVGLHAVANEGGHRDAAVLDLSVAEPADRLGRRLGDVERIPEANDRVQLLGELLEARLVGDLGRGPRLGLERDLVGEAHLGGRGARLDSRRERERGNLGEHVCQGQR